MKRDKTPQVYVLTTKVLDGLIEIPSDALKALFSAQGWLQCNKFSQTVLRQLIDGKTITTYSDDDTIKVTVEKMDVN